MVFWRTQLGPLWEADIPSSGTSGRLIGEIVCPDCGNVMGRLFDGEHGVDLRAWMRGSAVGDPGGRSSGYALFTVITADEPADDETADMVCWRGHGGMQITGADCRAAIDRYRSRGRKVRHPATRVTRPDA